MSGIKRRNWTVNFSIFHLEKPQKAADEASKDSSFGTWWEMKMTRKGHRPKNMSKISPEYF